MSSWQGWLTEKDLEESWEPSFSATLSGKRVLVIGASGCIGGAIAEVLCWQRSRGLDTQVIVAGRNRAVLERRFSSLGASVAVVDMVSAMACDLPDFDIVVHAASLASPRKYLNAPVATLQANAHGVAICAERMRPGDRMLYISSGEIYGSPPLESVPTPETYAAALDPLGERSCYTEGKRFAESLAMAHHRQFGKHVIISRPIHVYGAGLFPDDGRVICDFAAHAARGVPIEMHSDGSPTRAFCYISDATRLHLAMLTMAPAGAVFNVGREAPEISIRSLAEIVTSTIGTVPIRFTSAAHVAGSPQRSCPSMRKAIELLGYQPRIDLPEGLQRLVNFWKRMRLI